MTRSLPLFIVLGLLASPALAASWGMQREVGDFDLKMGTAPSRSMAQGLVAPNSAGMGGGFDLTHDSGLYFGQWTTNNASSAEAPLLEMDTYAGYKHRFAPGYGYELGVINYSNLIQNVDPSRELYSGMTVYGKRLGAAFANDPGRHNASVYADLGTLPLIKTGVSLKYTNYVLDVPSTLDSGGMVRSFNDWSVNLSRKWVNTLFNLTYSGTSLRDADCSVYSGHNTYCDSALMLKASHPFF